MKWNHIIVEGFCAKNWEYNSKHSKYSYVFKDGEIGDKVPNTDYDPDIKKPKRPKYCLKKICSACIKCKYLAYGNIDEDLDTRIRDVIHQYMEEEDRKQEADRKKIIGELIKDALASRNNE